MPVSKQPLDFSDATPKHRMKAAYVLHVSIVLLLLMGGDDRFIRRAIIVVREFGAACTFRHPVG